MDDLTAEDITLDPRHRRVVQRGQRAPHQEAADACAAARSSTCSSSRRTRTRTSFEIAAKRLSADGVNFAASARAPRSRASRCATPPRRSRRWRATSSIVRHKYAGAPRMLAEHMDAHIVNGGDGDARAPDAGAARPVHDARDARAARGADRRASSATSRTRASRARSCRRCGWWARRRSSSAPPTLMPARPDVLGAEVSYDARRGAARARRRLHAAHPDGARRGRCRSRACASTRSSAA